MVTRIELKIRVGTSTGLNQVQDSPFLLELLTYWKYIHMKESSLSNPTEKITKLGATLKIGGFKGLKRTHWSSKELTGSPVIKGDNRDLQ